MNKKTSFRDLYSFPGFQALAKLTPHPNDPKGRIVTVRRRQKKVFALAAERPFGATTTAELTVFETFLAQALESTWLLSTDVFNAHGVRP